jgi:hypothetical protein
MKRPAIITVICIAGFLSVVFTFPQVFSPPVKRLGVYVPAVYGILVAAHFMACVGLWYFKQWGAQLYLLAFFARTIFYILTGQTGGLFAAGLAVHLVFVLFLVRYHARMDTNL